MKNDNLVPAPMHVKYPAFIPQGKPENDKDNYH